MSGGGMGGMDMLRVRAYGFVCLCVRRFRWRVIRRREPSAQLHPQSNPAAPKRISLHRHAKWLALTTFRSPHTVAW